MDNGWGKKSTLWNSVLFEEKCEEYSMPRVKSKFLDVSNLVYGFCRHCSSSTGPRSVLFLAPCSVKHFSHVQSAVDG